jgi:hypothetical protein
MKRIILILIIFCSFPDLVFGSVSVQVYKADGLTPFDCNDEVMVGEKLSFVVSSDSNDYWSGGLFISGQDRNFGILSGRSYDPNTRDYTGSHLQASGELARVTDWEDSLIRGFDLFTFYPVDVNSFDDSTIAGDWFIIDYMAEQIGQCSVGFYDYYDNDVSWDEPVQIFTFSQVVSRDLNSDGTVDFKDLALFSNEWMKDDCAEPNYCNGADLDFDGDVDHKDLQLFTQFWLGQEREESSEDPNTMSENPNVIYRIVDAYGNSEITIDVNESITLYVNMETNNVNIFSFNIEADISNVGLGYIDNTEYNQNNPSGSGTARILAEPRETFFDYWGPGIQQEEGIRFTAFSSGDTFYDSHLASFVFTCNGAGDVTLSLKNWDSYGPDGKPIFPTLRNIIIHQTGSYGQAMMSSGSTETFETLSVSQSNEGLIQNDIAELVEFTEQLWQQNEEVRKVMSREELDEFISMLKESSVQ